VIYNNNTLIKKEVTRKDSMGKIAPSVKECFSSMGIVHHAGTLRPLNQNPICIDGVQINQEATPAYHNKSGKHTSS